MTIKKRLISLFLCFLAVFLFSGCAASRILYPISPSFKETFMVKTKDNWSLAVQHYPPQGVPKQKPPVILCHGLNQNYLCWDLMGKWSFAQYLSSHGYDVWSLSLRGSGKSTKPGWAQFLELNHLQADLLKPGHFDYLKFDWNLDDSINYDVPVLLQFVLNKTGAKEVTWIGHSMGGMVLYAYLGQKTDSAIKNAVMIGVIGKIDEPPTDIMKKMQEQEPFLRLSLFVNTKNVSVASAVLSDRLHGALQILNYNVENMDKETLVRYHTYVIENTSPGVFKQMKLMVEKGKFYSSDGKINYSLHIPHLKANLLCIAGTLDNLAPPASVRHIYRLAGSKDKTFRLFGRANGYSADYGHNDLLLGKQAPEEVYPYILAWLEKH